MEAGHMHTILLLCGLVLLRSYCYSSVVLLFSSHAALTVEKTQRLRIEIVRYLSIDTAVGVISNQEK
jgi:hypothetical protein